MKKLRPRLTFANVTSVVALFVALGGSAYAATQLPKNSVGTKQLKKNAVTGVKVKNQTLTGKDIELSKLGTVPAAGHAGTADTASALSPLESPHLVGAPGQPQFENGAHEKGGGNSPVSFYKDHEGIVHLEGVVETEASLLVEALFTLPPGYRPASGTALLFEQFQGALVDIVGPNVTNKGVVLDGQVRGHSDEHLISLSGITFRAQG